MDSNDIVLSDTAVMMISPDYKERFKAEYYQLTIRLMKLDTMIKEYELGHLSFTPTCPIDMLKRQAESMEQYKAVLIERAKQEDVLL